MTLSHSKATSAEHCPEGVRLKLKSENFNRSRRDEIGITVMEPEGRTCLMGRDMRRASRHPDNQERHRPALHKRANYEERNTDVLVTCVTRTHLWTHSATFF